MARQIDPARQRGRREAGDYLAFAYNDVSVMVDKATELLAQTREPVDGSALGSRMVESAAHSVSTLQAAVSALRDARDQTREIDITVEVPDPPQGGSSW